MNHTGTIQIKTERLLLRRFSLEDVDAVYQNYGSDPLVNRYISFAPCGELESAREFIRMHTEQYDRQPSFYGWAITVDREVIGSVGLFDVDDGAQQAELGYSIGSKWWGKGYATEAARAVIDHAFDCVGFQRIYASHHIDNGASGRVLEKIGMQFEGVAPDGQKNPDGTTSDLKEYGMLRQNRRKI